MKKIRSLLTVCLAAALMCGCGAFQDLSTEDETITESEMGISEETPESTAETEIEITEQTQVADEIISETEIYNENGISIMLNSVNTKRTNTVINITLANASDKDYSISAHSYAINGLMAGSNQFGIDNTELPSGKKTKIAIEIENNWLKENSINEIAELEFIFWAYYDGYKEFDTGKITVNTNLYDESKMYMPNGNKIYSDDNLTVWKNSGTSFTVLNDSSYNAQYTVENCSLNEWAYQLTDYTYDLYEEEIHSGAYVTFEIPIEKDFLDSNEIEKAENIEFDILLSDSYWNLEGDLWEYKSGKITTDIE